MKRKDSEKSLRQAVDKLDKLGKLDNKYRNTGVPDYILTLTRSKTIKKIGKRLYDYHFIHTSCVGVRPSKKVFVKAFCSIMSYIYGIIGNNSHGTGFYVLVGEPPSPTYLYIYTMYGLVLSECTIGVKFSADEEGIEFSADITKCDNKVCSVLFCEKGTLLHVISKLGEFLFPSEAVDDEDPDGEEDSEGAVKYKYAIGEEIIYTTACGHSAHIRIESQHHNSDGVIFYNVSASIRNTSTWVYLQDLVKESSIDQHFIKSWFPKQTIEKQNVSKEDVNEGIQYNYTIGEQIEYKTIQTTIGNTSLLRIDNRYEVDGRKYYLVSEFLYLSYTWVSHPYPVSEGFIDCYYITSTN